MGVVDSGDEEARALGGIVEVADIEEEEALLRGMRLNGLGGEGCVLENVAIILRESAMGLVASGQREGDLILGAGARGSDVAEGAAQIVERIGSSLGAVAGDELEAGIAENDGLIAVIGEDDEDGQDGVLEHLGMEDGSPGGSVIRVGAKGELLLLIARGHGGGRNQGRHDEVSGEGRDQERGEDGAEKKIALRDEHHARNYRRKTGRTCGRKVPRRVKTHLRSM